MYFTHPYYFCDIEMHFTTDGILQIVKYIKEKYTVQLVSSLASKPTFPELDSTLTADNRKRAVTWLLHPLWATLQSGNGLPMLQMLFTVAIAFLNRGSLRALQNLMFLREICNLHQTWENYFFLEFCLADIFGAVHYWIVITL